MLGLSLLATGTLVTGPARAATPNSVDSTLAAPEQASLTSAPTQVGQYADTLTFTLTNVSPSVVTSAGSGILTVTGTVKNTSKQALSDLEYIAQRGPALTSQAAIQNEVAHPSEPTEVVTQVWQPLTTPLAPGASAAFTAEVPLTGTGIS